MCGVTTALGSIMAADYVWVIGLTTTVTTAFFYEASFIGLGPYLPEITSSDEDRGKVGVCDQGGEGGGCRGDSDELPHFQCFPCCWWCHRPHISPRPKGLFVDFSLARAIYTCIYILL